MKSFEYAIFALSEIMDHMSQPPKAIKIPHTLSKHGDTRVDDYYWLNQRDNPEVKAYLDAENSYCSV